MAAASPLSALSPAKRTNSTAPLSPALWQRDEAASQCRDCSAPFGLSRR